jgi:predicted alpha/beta superfamily hydrolase
MIHRLASTGLLSALALCAQTTAQTSIAPLPPRPGMVGDFELHRGFASKIIAAPRDVIVYLPPGYRSGDRRYPVLYMHDGQNLFDPATGFAGQEWRLDETAEQLIAAGKIQPLIIVGIYNTGGQRTREYTSGMGDSPPTYARLIVEELKPFIDSRYRTLQGPQNTGLGGSSLGGLVSMAIGLQYPNVFGKLAILSPSVWWNDRVILHELERYGDKARPKIWLDIGTAEGNNPQKTVEDARALRDGLVAKGWKLDSDLRYFEAEGAAHNERAWSQRIGTALEFLFGPG